jgi:hypothetical protein
MRRRSIVLSLGVAALVALGVVALAPAPSHPPRGASAAVPDSRLVREYPLGERPLCCRGSAAARDAAPPPVPRVPTTGFDAGARAFEALVLAFTFALALVLSWLGWRFTRADGAWVRMKPRRRLRVGPAVYRWAQSRGFRYSAGRDALVLRALDGAFGPVLVLRSSTPPPPSVSAEAAASAPPAAVRQRPAPPIERTIDVACRLLPQRHHDAQLWQLTAVELRSRYVWAELLRRRGGPPTAQQISAFLDRIAGEMSEVGERFDAIAVPVHALPMLNGVALPTGVRLVVPEPTAPGTGLAAAVHELLVARHWRSALVPPEAPPLDELQRWLQIWVAEHNAHRHERSPSQLRQSLRMAP